MTGRAILESRSHEDARDRSLGSESIGGKTLSLEDQIFTESRILFCGIGIAIGLAVLLAWRISQGYSVVGAGGAARCAVDFCTIWVSGTFAAAGEGARVYDYSAFAAAQLALVGPPAPGFPPYHYGYPPIFLFFTYPLGQLPYFAAFSVWTAATLAMYVAAVYAIIPRVSAVAAALAPVVVAENILLGQNGLLSAGLIGLALATIERRPVFSGAVVSLLTFKPQFGVAFPLAFLASRKWRAFTAAAVGSLFLGVGAAAVFGSQTWTHFFECLGNRDSSLSMDEGVEITQQSLFGLLHWAVGGTTIPLLLHIVMAAAVAIAVALAWARSMPYELKAAALCLASVSITPYVEMYDLSILTIAGAFLVRDGLLRGFLPAERAFLLACFGSLLLLLLPIGPAIYAVLFCLVARRSLSSESSFHRPLRRSGARDLSEIFETNSIADY